METSDLLNQTMRCVLVPFMHLSRKYLKKSIHQSEETRERRVFKDLFFSSVQESTSPTELLSGVPTSSP